MGPEILFLLLPVAALSGWIIGRRGAGAGRSDDGQPFSPEYFKGLNYLLNEQPDKAVEVFVHMLEVDSETVETHYALANLFRRRGEVDRSIRIHQNLIARPTLTPSQRNQALYELGRDYMAAGLLDRAEALFEELIDDREYAASVGRQLLEIYQQEKEWEQAIGIARRLQGAGVEAAPLISHFFCELAEEALNKQEYASAARHLKKALSEDRSNVRVSLLEGRLELEHGNPRAAMRALKRVEGQNPAFLPEIITPLQAAYRKLGRSLEMLHYLRQVLREHESTSLFLAMAELVGEQQGEAEATATLSGYLQKHPSVWGMYRLIQLKLARSEEPSRNDLVLLKRLTEDLLSGKPRYACNNCGFSSRQLHWRCPSCKSWNTVAPIHGIEGE